MRYLSSLYGVPCSMSFIRDLVRSRTCTRQLFLQSSRRGLPKVPFWAVQQSLIYNHTRIDHCYRTQDSSRYRRPVQTQVRCWDDFTNADCQILPWACIARIFYPRNLSSPQFFVRTQNITCVSRVPRLSLGGKNIYIIRHNHNIIHDSLLT